MYSDIPMLRAEEKIPDKTGITIRTLNKQSGSRCGIHWHDYYTLDIILAGNGTHYINSTAYKIERGGIFLIRPSDIHYIDGSEDFHGFFIRFTEQAIPEKYRGIVHNCRNTMQVGEKELDALRVYCEAVQSGNVRLAEGCASPWESDIIAHNFSLLLLALASDTPVDGTDLKSDEKITTLMHYLDIHFRENITVEKAAAIANVSPSYFPAYFRKNVGTSYMEHLLSLRINYACALLGSGFSITDSCFSSGFGSLSHFNSIFKRKMGITPSKYKKQQMNP
ncbi:MAG: AraC family transcriptional regulator [Clostridia bacterium]|nr:AraC family transcriptional regulator [Clostridia bacterium]